MTVQDLLRRADEFGVQLEVREDRRVNITAPRRPPNALINDLKAHKFALVCYLTENRRGLLDQQLDAWTAATIFEQALSEFLDRHSSQWCCDLCGHGPTAEAAVLPMPVVGGDRIHLHAGCWPAWRAVNCRPVNATKANARPRLVLFETA
jgi:hypothetical protein